MNLHSLGYILTDLASLLLLRRGYAPLHCSAFKSGDATVVITAPPNTGKTLTSVMACMEHQADYIAEDLAITDGQDIFYKDYDRIKMCLLIQEGIERYGHSIHSFCFMSNHIHMLIQVNKIPRSKFIQNISFRYTRHINHTQKRIGHLFQGRYKSNLLGDNDYFLRLVRYIHLNPVRSGLVKNPYDYRWSSHRAYLGAQSILWLNTIWCLSKFSNQFAEARKKFQEYVLRGIDECDETEIYEREADKKVLGISTIRSKEKQEMESCKLSFHEIKNAVCAYFEICDELLLSKNRTIKISQARAIIALLANDLAGISIKDIAKELRRDPSSLSELYNKYKYHTKFSTRILTDLEQVKKMILSATIN